MATGTTKLIVRNHTTAPQALIVPEWTTFPDDPLNPLDNLLNPDRSVRYHNPSASGRVLIDVGSTARTTNVVGFLGLKRSLYPTQFFVRSFETFPSPVVNVCSTVLNSPTLSRSIVFPNTVKVGQHIALTGGATVAADAVVVSIAANKLSLQMSAVASATVNVAITATFNDYHDALLATPISSGDHDFLYELPSPVTHRYYEFEFPAVFNEFALSAFVAAQTLDLGIAYSPGSTDALIKQVVENQTVDGTTTLTTTGRDRQRFRSMFANITQAKRDALFDAARAKSIILMHPRADTSGVECRLLGNEIEAQHDFATPDVYTVTLNLETMP